MLPAFAAAILATAALVACGRGADSGATGTLGLGATLFALAMGVAKIYAVARGEALLERLKAIAPDRIVTFSNAKGSSGAFVKDQTNGSGADLMLDTLGAKAPRRAKAR